MNTGRTDIAHIEESCNRKRDSSISSNYGADNDIYGLFSTDFTSSNEHGYICGIEWTR